MGNQQWHLSKYPCRSNQGQTGREEMPKQEILAVAEQMISQLAQAYQLNMQHYCVLRYSINACLSSAESSMP